VAVVAFIPVNLDLLRLVDPHRATESLCLNTVIIPISAISSVYVSSSHQLQSRYGKSPKDVLYVSMLMTQLFEVEAVERRHEDCCH
jgi:hypothetical protein